MASGASPARSPRLPSPPPIAEDQIGPASPSAAGSSDDFGKLDASQDVAKNAAKRIRPGTKAADMAKGPPLVPLTEIDSPFQLAEYLSALHKSYTHPANSHSQRPIDRESARILAQSPENVNRELWLYELCRFHTKHLNKIVIALFAASPPCSSHTCPDMRASEWQYLCAVHDPPKSCSAIDYCCHTLDWAANMLTSTKQFPSRLTPNADASTTPEQQLRQLTNIFRRLYRIFAHAWFQHREVFWKVENQHGLYIFFKTVIDTYKLLPSDGYTIPEEAEGVEETDDDGDGSRGSQTSHSEEEPAEPEEAEEPEEPEETSESETTIITPAPTNEAGTAADDATEAEIEIHTEELSAAEAEDTKPSEETSTTTEVEPDSTAAATETQDAESKASPADTKADEESTTPADPPSADKVPELEKEDTATTKDAKSSTDAADEKGEGKAA